MKNYLVFILHLSKTNLRELQVCCIIDFILFRSVAVVHIRFTTKPVKKIQTKM